MRVHRITRDVGEPRVLNSNQKENRGVKIVFGHLALHRRTAQLVPHTVAHPATPVNLHGATTPKCRPGRSGTVFSGIPLSPIAFIVGQEVIIFISPKLSFECKHLPPRF